MRLDSIHKTVNGKTYTSHLIREAYRDNGRTRHRTIANLSGRSDDEIEAIRLALKHKGDLADLGSVREDVRVQQGLAVGAVFALSSVARRLGIGKALGNSQPAKQALWQVLARCIDQGSRLSAVRLAGSHAACDVLGLEAFDEDDLYANLDWLCENQAAIEDRLFRKRHPGRKAELFLYDVTSSYLEGVDNELAAFGYNRDKKRGKRQIVIGLLCDEVGGPLSVEVFAGNTSDTSTFASQIRKVADRFGGGEVTLVGDRGMIKGPQIELLEDEEGEFHYITAITKPQIESLLTQGVFQLGLFDERLTEVIDNDTNVRYILRRNPQRAEETATNRDEKCQTVANIIAAKNAYLDEHPRASVEVALRHVQQKIDKLRLPAWLSVSSEGRTLSLIRDEEALAEISKLDGCYCLKTDLTSQAASKEVVHDRYKGLANVEWAFRTCKTSHLEVRPIFVRQESRTRGHVFVVMLAYQIIRELARCWQALNVTVAEGISELSSLCMTQVTIRSETTINQIPTPRPTVQQLLKAADIIMPHALPCTGTRVDTKQKLPKERKLNGQRHLQ